MPADPWHQPDSIQVKNYSSTKDINKSRKKSSTEETSQNTVQNYINSPIDTLNDDCLMHVFLYLPIKNRIAIERGKIIFDSSPTLHFIISKFSNICF